MNNLPTKLVEPKDATTRYERALYWVNEAVRADEVMAIRDESEVLKLLGKQAKDRTLLANAAELQMRAERKLGEILQQARAAGQMSRGGRPTKTDSRAEPVMSTTVLLAEAGIDKKLSMKSQQLAKAPAQLFERMIAESRAKIESGKAVVINPLKDISKTERQIRRRIKEAQLAAKAKALPDEQYQLIYADPEWKYETWSENGQDRGAENHYPTSDLSVIKARPVGTLAAKDCVLFLWVTGAHLAAGSHVEVMRFWGFAPKAVITWDKQRVGTGYWVRNRVEYLVIGVRGEVPAPAPGTQWEDLVSSPKGAHSEKPDWAYELIEAYFPNLKKIELNARRRRAGWAAWGFEAPEDEATGSRPADPLRSEAATREGADPVASGGEAAALPASISHAPGEPAITGAASLAPVAPVSPLDDPGFIPAFLQNRSTRSMEVAP